MPDIRKPQCDTRTYSAFQLPNGLRAIVASDPDKSVAAAAALCVLAGSIHEPKEIPGRGLRDKKLQSLPGVSSSFLLFSSAAFAEGEQEACREAERE